MLLFLDIIFKKYNKMYMVKKTPYFYFVLLHALSLPSTALLSPLPQKQLVTSFLGIFSQMVCADNHIANSNVSIHHPCFPFSFLTKTNKQKKYFPTQCCFFFSLLTHQHRYASLKGHSEDSVCPVSKQDTCL